MMSIKMNEVVQPELDVYVELTDFSVKPEDIVKLEERILKENSFMFNFVTIENFFGLLQPFISKDHCILFFR